MGFWNSVIYITTSWAAVRLLFNGQLSGENAVKGFSKVFSTRSNDSRRPRAGRNESESVAGLSPVGDGKGYEQVV